MTFFVTFLLLFLLFLKTKGNNNYVVSSTMLFTNERIDVHVSATPRRPKKLHVLI